MPVKRGNQIAGSAHSAAALGHPELLFPPVAPAGGHHRDREYRHQGKKAGQSGGQHQNERHQHAHQRSAVGHGAQGSGKEREPNGHNSGRQTP